jgi:hypothetical protein
MKKKPPSWSGGFAVSHLWQKRDATKCLENINPKCGEDHKVGQA